MSFKAVRYLLATVAAAGHIQVRPAAALSPESVSRLPGISG